MEETKRELIKDNTIKMGREALASEVELEGDEDIYDDDEENEVPDEEENEDLDGSQGDRFNKSDSEDEKKEDDEGMGDLPLKSVRKRRVRKD